MKKLQDEIEAKRRGKRINLIRILFFFVFILLSGQIMVSNIVSSSGDKLQLLEQRYLTLSNNNEYLKKQIASESSLNMIQKEAENLGFVKNNSIVYLQNVVNISRLNSIEGE